MDTDLEDFFSSQLSMKELDVITTADTCLEDVAGLLRLRKYDQLAYALDRLQIDAGIERNWRENKSFLGVQAWKENTPLSSKLNHLEEEYQPLARGRLQLLWEIYKKLPNCDVKRDFLKVITLLIVPIIPQHNLQPEP
jgi:hypothetical protein